MAKRLKRTPWFPAEVKPVLPGLYESKGGVLLWLWSGKEWRSPGDSRTCFCQERTWRGLAEDPNRAPTRGGR